MSIADFAEKIYVELDKMGLHSSSIRVDISEIIDFAFRIQVCDIIPKKFSMRRKILKKNSKQKLIDC